VRHGKGTPKRPIRYGLLAAGAVVSVAGAVVAIAAEAKHQNNDDDEPDAGAVVIGVEAHCCHLTCYSLPYLMRANGILNLVRQK